MGEKVNDPGCVPPGLTLNTAVMEKRGSHLSPDEDALEHILNLKDKPFLQERDVDPIKGRGVFTLEMIEPFSFVVEFRGIIFSPKKNIKKLHVNLFNNYIYDFSWKDDKYRVDASMEDGTLGRLVNDNNISPNCQVKKIFCDGKPHLCLFATRRISAGEEITYNYGNFSYPWRAKIKDPGCIPPGPTQNTAVMEKRGSHLSPDEDALDHIQNLKDKPFLQERVVDPVKGRGVFTLERIEPSSFVVEFRGIILSPKKKKKHVNLLNNYVYDFSWKGNKYRLDASVEDGTLGRLVNDNNISPNCHMKKTICDGKPHLCLFAKKKISAGEEITYNYGSFSYPWRAKKRRKVSTSNTDSQTTSTPKNGGDTADATSELSGDDDDGDDDDDPPKKVKRLNHNNRNYCYVCGKARSKISRHLLIHADEEPEIAEAFALPKNSLDRKRLINELRNRGNYKHNQEVLRTRNGKLKVRRQSAVMSFNKFVYCRYCKGMYNRKEIWRHVGRCLSNTPTAVDSVGKRKVASEMVLAESPHYKKLTPGVKELLSTFNLDDISAAVTHDFLLIKLAQHISEKSGNDRSQYPHMREQLREMGKLLMVLSGKGVHAFEEAVTPRNFFKVSQAVREMAGFDDETQRYKRPSLALKLGHLLKQLAATALQNTKGDEQKSKELVIFKKMCETEWSEPPPPPTPPASAPPRPPKTIPFMQDVQLLYQHLESAAASGMASLEQYPIPQVYAALARVTLSQVSILNKCASEVSKMTLKTFQEREEGTRVLSKHFVRINTPGRNGQNVPILLTSQLVSAITLLVSSREACEVHADNPFLFARPDASAESVYHGRQCTRSYARLCGATGSKHLRSLQLQKHIARIFQILNLESDELKHLAKLVGHDIQADRDYYRKPEAAADLARISKLLLAMEKGFLEKFKGQSFGEINIEDVLDPDVEPNTHHADVKGAESDDSAQQSGSLGEQGGGLTPEQEAMKHIKACQDKSCLEDRFIDDSKGRGVFARKLIEASSFVVEYRGNVVLVGETRKKKYHPSLRDYKFDFSWNGRIWLVDASKEDGSLGRLVNDDHVSPNCEVRAVVCQGKPHLCLFAATTISPGDEITYNYGRFPYAWRCKDEDSAASSSADSGSDDEYVPEEGPSDDDTYSSDDNLKEVPESSRLEAEACEQPAAPSVQSGGSSSHEGSDGESEHGESEQGESELGESELGESEHGESELGESEHGESEHGDASAQLKAPHHISWNYCYVCGKCQTKISRHLFTHRHEDAEIAAAFALPVRSKKRKMLIDELRKRGNYRHNQQVLKSRCGELKVSKTKPNPSDKTKAFVTCLYCKGMYMRTALWRHLQNCWSKVTKSKAGVRISLTTLVAVADMADSQEVPAHLGKVLKRMKKDEVSSVVKKDPDLMQLAQCLFTTSKEDTSDHGHQSQRLREMGRLLLKLSQKSISGMAEALKPENFPTVAEAVREIAGFDGERKDCERPSLMLKIGKSLRKMGEIYFARALRDDAGREAMLQVETFLKLCDKEWIDGAAANGAVSRPSAAALTRDAQALSRCTEQAAAAALEKLRLSASLPAYDSLLRATVAQVALLNRCMQKMSRVTLKTFADRDKARPREDVNAGLSPLQQVLSERCEKIFLPERRGKKLVLLLTPEMLQAVSLIVEKRGACSVHDRNPFVFAKPAAISMSFYRGRACIRTFAGRCRAKNPKVLSSPFFSRHVARVYQILSLSDQELQQLAQMLGCNIPTSREYYQSPEAVEDIARISELVSAMEDGALEKFQGKTLGEIEIPDELEPEKEVEEENHENSEVEEEEASKTSHPLGEASLSTTTKHGDKPELEDTVAVEQNERSEESPSHSNQDASNGLFSDDDDDMHSDFDVDTDEDTARNEGDSGDEDTYSPAVPADSPGDCAEKHPENEARATGEEQENSVEVERTSSPIADAGNKTLLAPPPKMKEVKVLITKLDIEKFRSTVRLSQMPSLCTTRAKEPMKEQPVSDGNRRGRTKRFSAGCFSNSGQYRTGMAKSLQLEGGVVPTLLDPSEKPGSPELVRDHSICADRQPGHTKGAQMICSFCQSDMLKGQTAYQKKGFSDIFCSKSCLFEKFPLVKSTTKSCHRCAQAISQPLDVIMAAVDSQGTMKDFCSLPCLTAFKTTPQRPSSACSNCKKSCTNSCGLIVNEVTHRFCSSACLEVFRRDNMAQCEACGAFCHMDLLSLKTDETTKTFCDVSCLKLFKRESLMPCSCALCGTARPLFEMVYHRTGEKTMDLFCNPYCMKSHKAAPRVVPPGRSRQTTEEGRTDSSKTSDVANADAAANDNTPKLRVILTSTCCCRCLKTLPRGSTVCQARGSREMFCSPSCLSAKHPHVQFQTKTCSSCSRSMPWPHKNVIRVPVDECETMGEVCSEACLAAIQAKRVPKHRWECIVCTKICFCKYQTSLDGKTCRICGDACFISYHRANDLPVLVCDVCGFISRDGQLQLQLEADGAVRTVCSDECLVKFKEKIETPHQCAMCRTSHHMSHMVEDKSDEGKLEFFCSSRCMLVYKAQALMGSGRSSPEFLLDDNTKEEKPAVPKIKEEPMDEGHSQHLCAAPAEGIKDEPNLKKEDLTIVSVFSLVEPPAAHPAAPPANTPRLCSGCAQVLVAGGTVYQSKGHPHIFCSSSCLQRFYQTKAKKTCHFCLQMITQPQDDLRVWAGPDGAAKDFCSHTCLSSFKLSAGVSTVTQCSTCSRYSSKHKVPLQDKIHELCSDVCLQRFCKLNGLSLCSACRSCCREPLRLQADGGGVTALCGAACLARFKKKTQTPQTCSMCATSCPMSSMFTNISKGAVELFCSSSCVMASKIKAVNAAGAPVDCDNCGKKAVPACHLAMMDASIRNFCCLSCAMVYKEKQKHLFTNCSPKAQPDQAQPDQAQPDPPRSAGTLQCAQCQHAIKAVPRVIQTRDAVFFVCSPECSLVFQKLNNMAVSCEQCRSERICSKAERVDGKDCFFCSDGCLLLFAQSLERRTGKECHTCSYCFSTYTAAAAAAAAAAQHKGAGERFCSKECRANFKSLSCLAASCDACGHTGELPQRLRLLGAVKHFCDLKCLLHFCQSTASSSGEFPTEASPVISSVISLASYLKMHRSSSANTTLPVTQPSAPAGQARVLAHQVSTQTQPKELKNKAVLCAPLVHNKGVSCSTESVSTHTQTEATQSVPFPVPIPVPVYVPVPVHMYSQHTPQPVVLPVPMPVPVFLTAPPTAGQSASTSAAEAERRESGATEAGGDAADDSAHCCSRDTRDSPPASLRVFENLSLLLEVAVHRQPEQHQQQQQQQGDGKRWRRRHADLSPPATSGEEEGRSSEPAAHSGEKKRRRLPDSAQTGGECGAAAEDPSGSASRQKLRLESRCGPDAWRRWRRQRESAPSMHLSSPLSGEVLLCSAAELSDGLCGFIAEARTAGGETYTPDGLFYVCLSIQQHLLENGRMENIFSDRTYSSFSRRLTRMLRASPPASGSAPSCVEEDFLWECKQLGAYSPIVLLNTMLFFLCKHFGFTAAEQHRRLSFSHVGLHADSRGATYMRFYPPPSAEGAESDGVPVKKRRRAKSEEEVLEVMENTENPLRCPVRLYKFYLSKCPESVRRSSRLFYLQPDQHCVPSSPLWFSSTPLDGATLEAMLVRTLAVRDLIPREERSGLPTQP